MNSPTPSLRLGGIEVLRIVAALWVALYHFTTTNQSAQHFPTVGWLTWLGASGHLAVHLFFVISGFVIPYSLARSGYVLCGYFRFVRKRIWRLHPLYLINVLFCASMIRLPGGWSDAWPHFFYLNDILARPWYLAIYWTLALEMQYGLVIALLFPLLAHARAEVRWITLGAFLGSSLLGISKTWFPYYAGFYGLGMVVFWKHTGRIGWPGLMLGLAACLYVQQDHFGSAHMLCGGVAVALILWGNFTLPCGQWLADSSYAFYLFHPAVGQLGMMATVALWTRSGWTDSLSVLLTIAASAALAWFIHRRIELPLARWRRPLTS